MAEIENSEFNFLKELSATCDDSTSSFNSPVGSEHDFDFLQFGQVLQTEIAPHNYHDAEQLGDPLETDRSSLLSAAECGDVKAVRTLLSNGCSISEKTRYQSRGALQLASSYGQYDVVRELLQAGGLNIEAAVSDTGRSCLHEACQGGHLAVLELLLDHVDDVDLTDSRGQTAVHVAAANGSLDCLKALYDRGASLTITDKAGNQPVHLAVTRNHRAVIEYLYDCGVELHTPDGAGRLPVHVAARHGAFDCLVCLVELNCDVTATDAAGSQPVHHASVNNHLECVRFLISQGSSFTATQSKGKTPVHLAAEYGSGKVLHWLLEKGASVNTKDSNGRTACHLAALKGHGKAFNCLLQHGALIGPMDNDGSTALDSARKGGHPVLMDKAVNGQVACLQCTAKQELESWNAAHPVPAALKCVSALASHAYTNPLPQSAKRRGVSSRLKSTRMVSGKEHSTPNRTTSAQLPATRSLAARYLGEYLTGADS